MLITFIKKLLGLPSTKSSYKKFTVHETADVKSNDIGEKTVLWQYVVVLPNAKIGSGCNVNAHVFIENNVVVGNNVTLKCGVYLWDGIHIGDDVFIGPNATFVNDKLPRSRHYPEKFQPITIGKGASIGANATILGGISIGEYALIGAGSVVTKDVPAFALMYGNPAKLAGKVNEKGEIIERFIDVSAQ